MVSDLLMCPVLQTGKYLGPCWSTTAALSRFVPTLQQLALRPFGRASCIASLAPALSGVFLSVTGRILPTKNCVILYFPC